MPLGRAAPGILALVVATLLAGGCGSDEKRAVAGVLEAGLTSRDTRTVCEGSLAPGLLTRIYGGTAKCHRVEDAAGERVGQAQSVDVSHVHIHGPRATATVTLHGGSRDGAGGALTLARQDAGWRVTDLSVQLLRSQFEVGIRPMQSVDPVAKACITGKMRKVGDAEFRRLVFNAETLGQRRLRAVARRCNKLVAVAARMAV